jgi:hypothetical protein
MQWTNSSSEVGYFDWSSRYWKDGENAPNAAWTYNASIGAHQNRGGIGAGVTGESVYHGEITCKYLGTNITRFFSMNVHITAKGKDNFEGLWDVATGNTIYINQGTNCQKNVSYQANNNSFSEKGFDLIDVQTGKSFAHATVPPGGSSTLSGMIPCSHDWFALAEDGVIIDPTGDFNDPANGGGNTTTDNPDPGNKSGSDYNKTNGPVIWGGSSTNGQGTAVFDAAVNATLQSGFNRLAADNLDIKEILRRLATNKINLSITGALAQATGTMSLNTTGLASEVTLAGLSNFLAGRFGAPQTNSGSSPGVANTNWDAAVTAAATVEGAYGVDDWVNATKTIPADSGGIGDAMTLTFCGTQMNFDPVVQFPSVTNACRVGISFVAVIGFIMWFSALFWELVRAKGSVSTGGVPNLDAAGFNVAGLVVALIIPAVFIGGFSLMLSWLFAHVGYTAAQVFDGSAWATSLGTIGWHLLTSFFPVNLLLTLVVTKFTVQMTLAKMYNIGVNASRYLFGK